MTVPFSDRHVSPERRNVEEILTELHYALRRVAPISVLQDISSRLQDALEAVRRTDA